MNVVLVGYRGTGKSVVGALLAQQLGWRVIGLDAEIVRLAGQAIPEIVDQQGWPAFRDLEEQVVRDACAGDGQVIDCGGGVIERDANFPVLRSAGPVFWLTASNETIVRRIQDDDQRPSLTGQKSFTEEVAEVMQRRAPRYQQIAHHRIDTDDRTVEQVVDEIRRRLSHYLPENDSRPLPPILLRNTWPGA